MEIYIGSNNHNVMHDDDVDPLPCVHNRASNEGVKVCELCRSMLDYRPREGWHVPLSDEEHEEAIALFGGSTLPSSRRWKHLAQRMANSFHLNWARLANGGDPVVALPCSEEAFAALVSDALAGRALSPEQQHWLNAGVELRHGVWMRRMNGVWYLNDVPLGEGVTDPMVLEVLGDPTVRQGWDLTQLYTGLGALHIAPGEPEHPDVPHFFFRGRFHRLIHPHHRPIGTMLSWLSLKIRVSRTQEGAPKVAMSALAWAYDFKTCTTDTVRNVPHQRMVDEAFAHRPSGLFDCHEEPWMELYRNHVSTLADIDNLDYPLHMGGSRIKFRVRSPTNRTRLVQVPNRPDLWALLLSLAMSPLDSRPGRLLLGLQHNWSRPYFKRNADAPELVRSLQFCHDILNGILGARVAVQHDRVLIIGQLGHVYEVSVGEGQHGAPYCIQHRTSFEPHAGRDLCIHSGKRTNTVPIGDTLGSVFLSLYNDATAAIKIDSLASMMMNATPLGFPDELDDRWRGLLNDAAVASLERLGERGSLRPLMGRRRPWYGGRALPDDQHHRFFELEMQEYIEAEHHRRARRRGTSRHGRWRERFSAAMGCGAGLPYDDVVNAWRATVHPYQERQHRRPRHGLRDRHRLFRLEHRRFHGLPYRQRDDVHEVGDVRDGERRWCETFARVWHVLLRQPLGAWVALPANNGQPLTLERTELRVTVRNQRERNFLRRMVRWAGYVQDTEHERNVRFVRRDHPVPNARMKLSGLLGRIQQDQGVRGAPPRWWNYVEPFAVPDEMAELRWPYHEDLTDAPAARRQQRIDDAIPFNLVEDGVDDA